MKLLLSVSMMLTLTQTIWAQHYELVEPSGLVSASVEVGRGRLIVRERSGERIYFSREARYDSADDRFVGYFNFETNRVLRFPRSGRGVLQLADLDDANPQFQNTIRVARPAGSAPDRAWVADSRLFLPGYTRPPLPNPYVSGYRPVAPHAQSVLIDSKMIANPSLSPVRVVLQNSGRREIQVAVVDLKNPQKTRSMRIKSNAATEIQLDRDAGAKRIEHYRVVTPHGDSITREFVSQIQPTLRYEVVVHEWFMQSVAIDRTGKSPNVIEDIQFQGRPLGRFHLPPGDQLQSGTIDAYAAARDRTNQPIAPSDEISPLERAVLEVQQSARGKQ